MMYRARTTFECGVCGQQCATWSHVLECKRRREQEDAARQAVENGRKLVDAIFGESRRLRRIEREGR